MTKSFIIYFIDKQVLNNSELMECIYTNTQENYYASYDFSPNFYIELCKKGFIATSCYDAQNQQILLPEIQFEYAVLDFNNLHISKKVEKILRQNSYIFTKNMHFEKVIKNIEIYHKNVWLTEKYKQILYEINKQHNKNFELVSFEVSSTQTKSLIAGEIGYIIGRTYTSLSGFCSKEKRYNNWGKLQLVLLSQYLQKKQFDFWNLGHACLQYKIDLGATIYSRKDFLTLWRRSTSQ